VNKGFNLVLQRLCLELVTGVDSMVQGVAKDATGNMAIGALMQSFKECVVLLQ
jgi:hypothetical protein